MRMETFLMTVVFFMNGTQRMIQLNIEKACFDQSFFQNTLFLFALLSRFKELI
ncbi:hypothetical protein [Halalkalibacter alkalisediminis]|uniref:Uncharacterized protein n=2 Tax=Halalkalibacter alkalisediminis TaxID=935616 RepID=A0ABV6NNK5_9BACI|nr:hypothetical protein [Halalkalibacter alkalisediminis]